MKIRIENDIDRIEYSARLNEILATINQLLERRNQIEKALAEYEAETQNIVNNGK